MSKNKPIFETKHYSIFRKRYLLYDTKPKVVSSIKNRYLEWKGYQEEINRRLIEDKRNNSESLHEKIHTLKHRIKQLCAIKFDTNDRSFKDVYIVRHKKTGVTVEYDTLKSFYTTYRHKGEQFRHQVEHQRKKLLKHSERLIQHNYTEFGHIIRIGYVHREPGELLTIYVNKKTKELNNPKKPTDKSRHIGIEFEFTSKVDKNTLALALFNAGLVNICELKTDGSLRPKDKENGYEIAVLLKESNYSSQLKRLCNILKSINAETEDRRCGLHVHLDVRSRNKELAFNNLVACQNLLYKMMPSNRRNGEFCHKVRSKKFPTNFTGDRQERYKSINAASFYRHGTIEIRMHEGTVDFNDVRNWISLLVRIVNYKTRLMKSVSSVNMLSKLFELNSRVKTHVQDRINKWNVLEGRSNQPRVTGSRLNSLIDRIDTLTPRPTVSDQDSLSSPAADSLRYGSSWGSGSGSIVQYSTEYVTTPTLNELNDEGDE